MFIYFWERERQSVSGVGAGGEGDTEYKVGSRLWAIRTEPNEGFELMNLKIMTWVKVGRLTDWATQAPLILLYFTFILYSIISLYNVSILLLIYKFCFYSYKLHIEVHSMGVI